MMPLTCALALVAMLAPDPHVLVESALAALRYRATVPRIESIRLTGVDHTWILGNAERANGPWRVAYEQFSELSDPVSGSFRRSDRVVRASGDSAPERLMILTDSVFGIFSNGRFVRGSRGLFEDLVDRVDGSPVRALRLAEESRQLVYERAVARHGVSHDVVSFPWRNGRMRIEISRETHLPDAVEIVRTYPDDPRRAPFGDVTVRTENVDWRVTPSGAYWPMEQKVSLDGEPLRDVTYEFAALDAAPAARDSFAFSDSARAQYAAASRQDFSRLRLGDRGRPSELAPGIVRIPDFWAQTLVKQPDGVVIFEAHISARYFDDVMAEAKRRWPGSPVKAVVLTSDPWAHMGGVREAMALGLRLYVPANSVPFLERLARAPHSLSPDLLARSHRTPLLVPVSSRTVIGTGDNRIELYPVRGPYAERMLMAYFPGHRLLYGADLVFPNQGPDGKPTPGFLDTEATDLRNAVAREHLAVDELFCVQNYGPFHWNDFVAPMPAAATPRVTVADLTPRFLTFYDSATSRPLDPDTRWALWKRLYGFAAVPPTPAGDSIARRNLESAWARYPAALPRIRRGAASLGIEPDTVLRRIVALLGCREHTEVRLVAFVGTFDENAFQTTTADGTPAIAIPVEAGDARRAAVHELTHAVHRGSGCANITSGYQQTLAELVVSEGLAMRVVEALLPGHEERYYISASQRWLDSARARRPAILRGVHDHLGEAGVAQRFTYGTGTTGLSREAYYAGWEIVGALLHGGTSLHQIATTPPDQLPRLVDRAIDALRARSGPLAAPVRDSAHDRAPFGGSAVSPDAGRNPGRVRSTRTEGTGS